MDRDKKVNIILLLIVIFVLLDVIASIASERDRQFRENVSVENFQVCDFFVENEFNDIHCKKHFPEEAEQLFACGEVVLPNPQQRNYIDLLIVINNGEESSALLR